VTNVRYATPGAGTKYINATRDESGSYGMVYLAASRSFVLDSDKLSGESLHFWWFDPRTGTNIDLGIFPRARRFEITPPSSGENLDWILVCDDVAKGYSAPGLGETCSPTNRGRIKALVGGE
jgi:hypothetical protein